MLLTMASDSLSELVLLRLVVNTMRLVSLILILCIYFIFLFLLYQFLILNSRKSM